MTSVNSEAIGGVHQYVLYAKETAFNTEATANLHFGLMTNFRGNISNDLQEHRGFVGTTTGGREIVKFTSGKLGVNFTYDMKVTNWKFLEFVLGKVTGASNPYTYSVEKVPPSFTLTNNIVNPGPTDPVNLNETFTGSVVNNCTIKTSVGQPVFVSMDCLAGLCKIGTTVSSAVALPDEGVYNFTGGSVELPSGTALPNIIDSIEVSIGNNQEMLYGVGSRLAKNALPKELNLKLRLTLKYLSNTLVTAALGANTPTATGGPTENATVLLTFADGARNIAVTLSGVPMSDFARSIEINTPIGEDISLTAKTISAAETR